MIKVRTGLRAQDFGVPDFLEDAVSAVAELTSDAAEEVVDFGGDVVEFGVDLAGDARDAAVYLGGLALDATEEVVDYLAPGLLNFLRGDVFSELANMFCRGIDHLVSTLISPLGQIDVMSGIEMFFRSLTADVEEAYGALGTVASAAVGALLRPALRVVDVFGDDIVGLIQGLSDAVSGVFTSLWDNIAQPVLQVLGAVGSIVWEVFTGIVSWIWRITAPIRKLAEFAWEWLLEQFGLAWDSTASVREWLTEKAAAAWDVFLRLIEPIREPLMAVGAVLLMLSPLGPIVILTQVLPPVWDKLKWLAANWQDTEVVVRARELLANDVLPFLVGAVEGLKQIMTTASAWLAGFIVTVARGMQVVISVFSWSPCLKSVTTVLDHVADQFDRLGQWADCGFAGLGTAVGALFETIWTIFQPIWDFLVRLLLVAANPPLLPVAIAAAIWLLLPEEFKPPVIRFILGLLIAFLSGFPAFLTGLGPLASVLKSAVLGFLRHMRDRDKVDDQTRVNASNKMAQLMAGGGIQFIAGFAIGLVHGLIEGIIDPFKLLFMLFELIVAAVRVLKRVLAPAVAALAPAPVVDGIRSLEVAMAVPVPATGSRTTAPFQAAARGSPKTGTEVSTAASAEATSAFALEGPASAGGEVIAVPGPDAAEMPGTAASEATGAAATTMTRTGAQAAEDAIFARTDLESDEEILRRLPVDTLAGINSEAVPDGVSEAGLTGQMRTEVEAEGSTVGGLAALLGDAWRWLMDASGRLGALLAAELLKFLALSDYAIGRKTGWLAGMILLEALIAYFTAGGYTVLKQGASLGRRLLAYLLRFLDVGGEILGVLGRALAPLKGIVMRGFRAVRNFLGRFAFIRNLFRRLEELAWRIFRFGDDAAVRAPAGAGMTIPAPRTKMPGRSPPAPHTSGVPGAVPTPRTTPDLGPTSARVGAESTEAAGARAAREAMDVVPAHRGGDVAQEVGEGSLRAVDEPGVPRAGDKAAKSSQLLEAELAARMIVRANDVVDTPVPIVLGQLMTLKRKYRWIDTFEAGARGAGRYDFVMVASNHPIGPYTIQGKGPAKPPPPTFEEARDALNKALARPAVLADSLGPIGTAGKRRTLRRRLIKELKENTSHPLSFLLYNGKLRPSTSHGITQEVWLEMPEIVEAGHAISAKSLTGAKKGTDRFMVMSAHHNRLISSTIEHPGKKGAWMEAPYAIEIGGVPVDPQTAIDWVLKELLPVDVLAAARPVIYQ
ncbi:polymorphic toxin type 5 domain-containing protein [Citricoccus zhacaiensis]|uniref:polymorphic toxin type 5 domain-containing protein n=1 Tax=Citricoccus zhacaiensis TaxID=489142 RepID=UPI003CEA68A3